MKAFSVAAVGLLVSVSAAGAMPVSQSRPVVATTASIEKADVVIRKRVVRRPVVRKTVVKKTIVR